MADGKKTKGKKTSLKKEIFLQVFNQLSGNMEWLKMHVGEKKWGNRIKKAAKLLSEGVKEKKSKTVKSTKTEITKKDTSGSTPTPIAEQLT
ncbi:hypothetical protein [Terrimonas pollutisoli]|uniref:hypothetical protein n=1 Tax=Terrimonas pollutisoli TaxID=3034147 RepID=UPI0023ED9D76|nr:hypothetical protein [Terrimonas sp. H1YJ31]